MKISIRVSEKLSGHDFKYSNLHRGIILQINVGGVMVLVHCTLSDDVLNLYKVS